MNVLAVVSLLLLVGPTSRIWRITRDKGWRRLAGFYSFLIYLEIFGALSIPLVWALADECESRVASVLEKKTTYAEWVSEDCGKVTVIRPTADRLEGPITPGKINWVEAPPAPVIPREKPKCKMKNRVWFDGQCWIPSRIKLMR